MLTDAFDPTTSRFARLTPHEQRAMHSARKRLKEVERLLVDPAMMALPHPVRIAAVPGAEASHLLMAAADPRHQPRLREMLRDGLATNDTFQALDELGDARIVPFLGRGLEHGSGGGGGAGAMFQAARYELGQGCLYSFSDELVDILADTDLGDVPIEELKLPRKNIYIQLGLNRHKARFHLRHPESGRHALEGAYVSETADAQGRRRLEITMTGSPVGHSEMLDDCVEWISMSVEADVTAEQAASTALYDSALNTLTPFDHEGTHQQSRTLEAIVRLVSKAILFIGMPQARTAPSDAGTVARLALARAVSGAHKRKAQKTAALSYDCILVDAPEPTAQERSLHERHGHVASHWRSAHFRHQRHGPQLSQSKVVWIPRTLINAELLGRCPA